MHLVRIVAVDVNRKGNLMLPKSLAQQLLEPIRPLRDLLLFGLLKQLLRNFQLLY